MNKLFILLIIVVVNSSCYKPVILLHGILTGFESLELIKFRIEQKHPGTIIYNIDRFGGWSSLDNLNYQVQQLSYDFNNYTTMHPEGIHLLGYSQGALLARTILQANPNHTVHNFISLSGPQAGQYGTQFLHLYFPGLALESAYELFYSRVGQHTSVGNYWNDPYHRKLYIEYSQYLPFVNNELPSNNSKIFKESLVKLKNMILIGGPDDNVITPWQSSQFGYYDSNGTVINFMQREIFLDDKIGLKTLYQKKKLKIITVPGVNHFDWHLNISIVDNYILKYLD